MTSIGTYLAAGVYLSEAPSSPRFLFGVVKQFFKFGICSNTVYNSVYALHTTRSPPPGYTLCRPVLIHTGKGGGSGGGGVGELERRKRSASSQDMIDYKLYYTPVKTTFRVWCLHSY
jgi:hypothetical protein